MQIGSRVPKFGTCLFALNSQVVSDIPDDLIKLECAVETARARLAGLGDVSRISLRERGVGGRLASWDVET